MSKMPKFRKPSQPTSQIKNWSISLLWLHLFVRNATQALSLNQNTRFLDEFMRTNAYA